MSEPKNAIICPRCSYPASLKMLVPIVYRCDCCGFTSTSENCIDVSYKDMLCAPLSNLYPHRFELPYYRKLVAIPSMESFLQGLKIKEPIIQLEFMTQYSGMDAKKMGKVLDGWKKDQLLYFEGKAYERESEEYTKLITSAYDALYESNPVFREIVLPRFKGYRIIHSIGSDKKSETVLTEAEFRYQINRLISKLED